MQSYHNENGELHYKVITKLEPGQSKVIRIPQKLFDPCRVKTECKKEKYELLGKSVYSWQNNYFRCGYLYLLMPISRLQIDKVNPRLEEVQAF
jgi:transcription elongation factor